MRYRNQERVSLEPALRCHGAQSESPAGAVKTRRQLLSPGLRLSGPLLSPGLRWEAPHGQAIGPPIHSSNPPPGAWPEVDMEAGTRACGGVTQKLSTGGILLLGTRVGAPAIAHGARAHVGRWVHPALLRTGIGRNICLCGRLKRPCEHGCVCTSPCPARIRSRLTRLSPRITPCKSSGSCAKLLMKAPSRACACLSLGACWCFLLSRSSLVILHTRDATMCVWKLRSEAIHGTTNRPAFVVSRGEAVQGCLSGASDRVAPAPLP